MSSVHCTEHRTLKHPVPVQQVEEPRFFARGSQFFLKAQIIPQIEFIVFFRLPFLLSRPGRKEEIQQVLFCQNHVTLHCQSRGLRVGLIDVEARPARIDMRAAVADKVYGMLFGAEPERTRAEALRASGPEISK
jgi:hypothetical protein